MQLWRKWLPWVSTFFRICSSLCTKKGSSLYLNHFLFTFKTFLITHLFVTLYLMYVFKELSSKMCINNPDKPCKSNGQCGGACKTNAVVKPVQMVFDSIQWYKAVDYADLLRMLQQNAGKRIRLLGANTGTGKLKSSDQFELTNINLAPVTGNKNSANPDQTPQIQSLE